MSWILNIEYWIYHVEKNIDSIKQFLLKFLVVLLEWKSFFSFLLKLLKSVFMIFFFLERIKLDIKKDVDSISSNFLKL